MSRTSVVVTVVEKETALRLTEARLQQVMTALDLLRAEFTTLQKVVGEMTDVTDVIPAHERKWKDHQARITAMVKVFLKHSSYQLKDDLLKVCQIRLRKTIGLEGAIFDWELVLPEDYRIGKHYQVLTINACGLPGAYSENEPYITWLAEQKFISIEIKINPSI